MKKTIIFTLTIFLTSLMLATIYSGPAVSVQDGTEISVSKCKMCHKGTSKASLAKPKPQDSKGETMRSGKIAGPELLNIKREPAFLKKYLRQQIDLYGKRHPIAFTGSDQELDDIIARIKAQRN